MTAEDVPEWRRLRRRMLVEHPTAFLEHPDDFSGRDDTEVAGTLAEGNVVGVFLDGTMIGSGGYFPDRASKRRHVATIWGMYVAPEARSLGAGRALLDDLLQRLGGTGTEVATLDVAEDNAAARHLYQSAGFETLGPGAGCDASGRSIRHPAAHEASSRRLIALPGAPAGHNADRDRGATYGSDRPRDAGRRRRRPGSGPAQLGDSLAIVQLQRITCHHDMQQP